MCFCVYLCVGFSYRPLVHSEELEDPQELEVLLQAVQAGDQDLERPGSQFKNKENIFTGGGLCLTVSWRNDEVQRLG